MTDTVASGKENDKMTEEDLKKATDKEMTMRLDKIDELITDQLH